MGWSATAAACNAVDFIFDMIADPNGTSNGWTHGRHTYFWEHGREQADGAITGSVHRNGTIEVTAEHKARGHYAGHEVGEVIGVAYKAGTVRIEPDGKVTRFPHLPKWARHNIKEAYRHGMLELYHTRRNQTGSAL